MLEQIMSTLGVIYVIEWNVQETRRPTSSEVHVAIVLINK